MAELPYVACYLAAAVSVFALIARIAHWSKLPLHVRWELYPVAHEPGSKARYGGSYLEESQWWGKPREISRLNELRVMVPEMLFLVAVREHNRALWLRTFPFHFGLYLVGGSIALTLLTGAVGTGSLDSLGGSAGATAQTLIAVLGVAGLVLGLGGALGLLHRRLTVRSIRAFTTPADLFNLGFFIVVFASGLATFAVVESAPGQAVVFASNLLSFNLVPLSGTGAEALLPTVTTVLGSALVAYIPLTHMSHFIGKYFAYHSIRWNDRPNLAFGPEEARIKAVLGSPVTWAAKHINGDGRKTWVDVASDNPAERRP